MMASEKRAAHSARRKRPLPAGPAGPARPTAARPASPASPAGHASPTSHGSISHGPISHGPISHGPTSHGPARPSGPAESLLAWGIAASIGFAVAAFAASSPLFATDAACRYAPMAEAFAAGDWAEAFHPRFGVGLSVLAGLLRMATGLDGYAACAAVSSFAWALGAAPVYAIACRVFGRRTAFFAVALYLICPQPLIWGLKGLREPFKLLGFLLMTDAILSVRHNPWPSAIAASLALWLLFTFKCDAILLGGALAIAYAAIDRFCWRTLAVALSGLAALQPMCALVYSWTGWWLPAPHYVAILQKFL